MIDIVPLALTNHNRAQLKIDHSITIPIPMEDSGYGAGSTCGDPFLSSATFLTAPKKSLYT